METSKTKRFRQISGQLADLYEKKNADYGAASERHLANWG